MRCALPGLSFHFHEFVFSFGITNPSSDRECLLFIFSVFTVGCIWAERLHAEYPFLMCPGLGIEVVLIVQGG